MNRYIHIILAGVLLFSLFACESEEQETTMNMQPLRIRAEVASSGFTRASIREDDGFSVNQFSNGDHAGFFTEGGGAGNKAFENEHMIFKDGYFESFNGVEADINRVGKTLLYYPYSENPNGRQLLRQKSGEYAGEVFDFLYSTTVGNVDAGAYVATFEHTFSMFIIEGGTGFKKLQENNSGADADHPKISITMTKPLETVEFQRITDPEDTNYKIGYKVVFNGEYTGDNQPDDSYADFVGHYNPKDNKYYIIVPCDGVTQVQSINVIDDYGRAHEIPWSGWLAYGYKFPITLELDEMVPVINLHNITPWGGHTELNTTQERGIGDASEFNNWVGAYNTWKTSPTAENEQKLLNYGNKVEIIDKETGTKKGEYWHFLLTTDIDLSSITGGETAKANLITTLSDVLDGCGHTLSGIHLAGTNAAMIGSINGANASVRNLTVEGLTITTTGTSSVGALATSFTSGSIENCSFPNLKIDAHSPAGVIAGTIGTDVTIKNCNASGSIFSTETVDNIVGTGSLTDEQRKGCEVTNVFWGKQQ